MKKILFFFLVFLTLFSFIKAKHPYHVGSLELNYNAASKTFEISGKFFLDDLENALKDQYGKAVQFNNPKYKAEINALLKDYCALNLSLKADQKYIRLNYLGFEEDGEAVRIYLESETLALPRKVETSVGFLYRYFDDQITIIHLIVNGKRQSEKLVYPDQYVGKTF